MSFTPKPSKPKEGIRPSKKLLNFVLIFRIGIALFALTSLLLTSGCQTTWIEGKPELVKAAIVDNTYLESTDYDAIRTRTLDAEKELVLIDYRSQNICGLQGCLYNLYLGGNKIWSKYLQPDLPANIDLFTLNPVIKNALPCLDVKQYDQNLSSMTYCYEGETYILDQSFSE